ncbi:hypothetical protein [Aeromicrobium sp. REDSEA-S32_B7]|uniref:hypothetical protein n=1 Tax=Aeromicrobium sp. REDSEA-S32_B7 TaxID=1811526 RepID=UPI00295536FD|nr:hypothetical protein [Aeromicrobium sp. REDSEA-S32_B7]
MSEGLIVPSSTASSSRSDSALRSSVRRSVRSDSACFSAAASADSTFDSETPSSFARAAASLASRCSRSASVGGVGFSPSFGLAGRRSSRTAASAFSTTDCSSPSCFAITVEAVSADASATPPTARPAPATRPAMPSRAAVEVFIR